MASKPKQFTRPQKKHKLKAAAELETADDFQEAADFEEDAGGKWRAGDLAKSGRAFVRALDVYDRGLQRHPQNFDLAYNKARLMLEISQQPALVDHIGLPLTDLLKNTLDAHRAAQALNGENADLMFNTAQVLTTLGEELSEAGSDDAAVALLQEALELLSACLSRQEMLLEQQRVDFAQVQDQEMGGVPLDQDEIPTSTSGADVSEQVATIENPVSPQDLLDTIQSSMSALTTLVSLAPANELQMLGNMAQSLIESKAANCINLLPESEREAAQFSVGLARANFVVALADGQYNIFRLSLRQYLDTLDNAFNLPRKEAEFDALLSESEARTELVLTTFTLSAMDALGNAGGAKAAFEICWKQLGHTQDLLTSASKLDSGAAKERRADVFELKGNVELLRYRLATSAGNTAWLKGAPTLLQNARTFFLGAYRHAQANGENGDSARLRWVIADTLLETLHSGGGEGIPKTTALPFDTTRNTLALQKEINDLIDEQYLEADVASKLLS